MGEEGGFNRGKKDRKLVGKYSHVETIRDLKRGASAVTLTGN